jgi:hypothetical protein
MESKTMFASLLVTSIILAAAPPKANSDSPEGQYRAKLILKKLGVKPGLARAARIVRLLERAGTKEAKALLDKLGDGVYGSDYTAETRAAQMRLKGPK